VNSVAPEGVSELSTERGHRNDETAAMNPTPMAYSTIERLRLHEGWPSASSSLHGVEMRAGLAERSRKLGPERGNGRRRGQRR